MSATDKNLPTIALITNDVIGRQMAGPGIRYWEFARVLGRQFPVKLIVPPIVRPEEFPSLPANFPAELHFCSRPQDFRRLIESCQVVVTLGTVLFFYPFLTTLGKPLVLDMYAPFLLEGLQLNPDADLSQQLTRHENYLQALRIQLQAGDFFLCADEKQRDYWLGMLSVMGRVNHYTHQQDPTLHRLIDVVPFGLPEKPPQHTRRVLKGVYKSIATDDRIILWGGGIWNWLDPLSLIRAMPLILEEQSRVKLFFMGINRPNQNVARMKAVDQAIRLSQELGLYEKFVFFNDWVTYDQRQNYLLEADIGVSFHLDHLEARFAFRTRLLDYLWAGLPIVCTTGDPLGETLAAQGLAHLVAPSDVTGIARTILNLLNKPTLRADYVARAQQVAPHYRWEIVTRPLIEFCQAPYLAADKPYLTQNPFFIKNRSSVGYLWRKAVRAFQLDGLNSLLRQSRDYLRWQFNRHQKKF